MAEDKNTTKEINRLLPEIAQTKEQIKTLRSQLKDALTQNEEYVKLQAKIKELADKRAEGKKLLLADRDYVKLNTEIEELCYKLKDLNEILSHYLINYYNQTNKTQIIDDQGDTRQVILQAKIGQPEALID